MSVHRRGLWPRLLCRSVRRLGPLPEATGAIAAGRVLDDETGEVFRWRPQPMVLPVSEKLMVKMKADETQDRAVRLSRLAPAALPANRSG